MLNMQSMKMQSMNESLLGYLCAASVSIIESIVYSVSKCKATATNDNEISVAVTSTSVYVCVVGIGEQAA